MSKSKFEQQNQVVQNQQNAGNNINNNYQLTPNLDPAETYRSAGVLGIIGIIVGLIGIGIFFYAIITAMGDSFQFTKDIASGGQGLPQIDFGMIPIGFGLVVAGTIIYQIDAMIRGIRKKNRKQDRD